VLVIGIDENGLGPLLGPLVVTGSAFEMERYDREDLWRTIEGVIVADDSKKLWNPRRLGPAEAETLRWLQAFSVRPSSHEALVDEICTNCLPLPCEASLPAHCRPSEMALPVWGSGGMDDGARGAVEVLGAAGIRPVAVRSISSCPGALNVATGEGGMNKFRLDLHLMVALAKQLTEGRDEDVLVICGKVGSTRRYGPWLADEGLDAWWTEEETSAASTYRVRGLGRLRFVRDADGLHLPVAVASMVGKYLRELAMHDLNALLGPGRERKASGYRDRVTAAFVDETEERRSEIGLEDCCFLRSC